MGQQVLFFCELKLYNVGVVKTSLNKAKSKKKRDPKLSDLFMNRLKLAVKGRGGPNSRMWQNMGMICE